MGEGEAEPAESDPEEVSPKASKEEAEALTRAEALRFTFPPPYASEASCGCGVLALLACSHRPRGGLAPVDATLHVRVREAAPQAHLQRVRRVRAPVCCV